MIKQWHFDIGFVIAIALLVFYAFGPSLGIESTPNALVITGFGILMGFIFTRRDKLTTTGRKENQDDSDPTETTGKEE